MGSCEYLEIQSAFDQNGNGIQQVNVNSLLWILFSNQFEIPKSEKMDQSILPIRG